MTKNQDSIHIWGDEDTTVWVRRKGAGDGSKPSGLAAPIELSGFKDFGWLGEDGIDLDLAVEVEKFKAYQGGVTVKNRVTSTERSFKLQAMQEDPLSTEVFWDHDGITDGDSTAPGTIARYDLPKSIGYSEWEFLIDFVDAGKTKRLVATAAAGERGTVPHKNTEITLLEITFDIIDAYVLTDDEAFVDAIPVTP